MKGTRCMKKLSSQVIVTLSKDGSSFSAPLEAGHSDCLGGGGKSAFISPVFSACMELGQHLILPLFKH